METLAQKIMNVFEAYRKRISDEVFDNRYIMEHIQKCIDNNQTIRLIFPTLHCKSINTKSVLNHLPDASDILSIYTIENIIAEINALYVNGIEIAIVHEAHFYGRVGIVHTDYLLNEYLDDLNTNITHPDIKNYKINDFFPLCKTYDQMRDEFYTNFVPSLDAVNELLTTNPELIDQYTNYMCFIKNEFVDILCPHVTNTAIKKWIKEIAKEQLRVYIGFSKLISLYFEGYLRVSALYKSPDDRDKLGIELIPNNTNLATPGFNVLFKNKDGEFCLKKRKDVDLEKVTIKYFKNGRYIYYQERLEKPVLLLDFDGVICDNSELAGYKLIGEMLKEKGLNIEYDRLIERFLGAKLQAIADILNKEYQQTIIDNNFISTFRTIYQDYLDKYAQKVDRIDSLLISFKHKYICTSNRRSFVHKFLEKNNLAHLFNYRNIITLDDVKKPKPAPDLYLKCIAKAQLKLSPQFDNFIAIEDSYDGVLSAKAAGVKEVIGFVGASSVINKVLQESRLLKAGANRVFHDMASLKTYVLNKYND